MSEHYAGKLNMQLRRLDLLNSTTAHYDVRSTKAGSDTRALQAWLERYQADTTELATVQRDIDKLSASLAAEDAEPPAAAKPPVSTDLPRGTSNACRYCGKPYKSTGWLIRHENLCPSRPPSTH